MDYKIQDYYFKWNEALIKHFLSTKNEIILCVDEAEIEYVGKKYNLPKKKEETYVEAFLSTVKRFTFAIDNRSKDILKIARIVVS